MPDARSQIPGAALPSPLGKGGLGWGDEYLRPAEKFFVRFLLRLGAQEWD